MVIHVHGTEMQIKKGAPLRGACRVMVAEEGTERSALALLGCLGSNGSSTEEGLSVCVFLEAPADARELPNLEIIKLRSHTIDEELGLVLGTNGDALAFLRREYEGAKAVLDLGDLAANDGARSGD